MAFVFSNTNYPPLFQGVFYSVFPEYSEDDVISSLNTLLNKGATDLVFIFVCFQGLAYQQKDPNSALFLHQLANKLLPDLQVDQNDPNKYEFYLVHFLERIFPEQSDQHAHLGFAIEITRAITSDPVHLQSTLFDLIGYDYELIGDLDQALEQYRNALNLDDSPKTKLKGMANIANIYKKQGKVSKAKEYYEYVLNSFKESGDLLNEILTYRQLIILTRNHGLHDDCVLYHNQMIGFLDRVSKNGNKDILWAGLGKFFDIIVDPVFISNTPDSDPRKQPMNIWKNLLFKSVNELMSDLIAMKKANEAIKYIDLIEQIASLK